MIKVNELMLGDLVYFLTDERIVKITAIDVTGSIDVEFTIENLFHHSKVYEKDIYPIPLTEEILLKNGFALVSFDRSLIKYYRLPDIEGGGFIEIDNYDDGDDFYATITCNEIKLEYVHQLQQLLKQCRLNELANNLKI